MGIKDRHKIDKRLVSFEDVVEGCEEYNTHSIGGSVAEAKDTKKHIFRVVASLFVMLSALVLVLWGSIKWIQGISRSSSLEFLNRDYAGYMAYRNAVELEMVKGYEIPDYSDDGLSKVINSVNTGVELVLNTSEVAILLPSYISEGLVVEEQLEYYDDGSVGAIYSLLDTDGDCIVKLFDVPSMMLQSAMAVYGEYQVLQSTGEYTLVGVVSGGSESVYNVEFQRSILRLVKLGLDKV